MKTMIAALGLLLVLASCQTTPIPVPEDKSSEWEAREALTRDRDSLLAKTGQLEFQILGLKATLKVNEGLLAQYQEQLKVLSDDLSVMARLKEGSRAQAESALASALMESESLKAEIAQLKQERNRLSQQLVEEAQRIAAAADQLRKTLKAEIDRGNLEVVQFESILIVNINDSLLFAPDSPLLKDQYKPILAAVADAFRQFPDKVVRVEGHTAVAPSRWSSSWDLGAARAVNVVLYLQQEQKIDPTRLVALSFGEYRPLAPNTTAEGRSENRRVQLVLVERPLYQVQELINSRAQ